MEATYEGSTSAATAEEAAPPLAVVLRGQLEVCECHNHKGRHIEQDDEYTHGML